MALDGTFPGRDLDEILESMEDVDSLDQKIRYIQDNFSMDEMKKLEDEGSETAEEALIQTARENAAEDQAEEFIRGGFNERWQENPHEGLAVIEKAIERHPNSPDILSEFSSRDDKVEIFRNLLEEGHVRTAEQFNELVGGVRQSHNNRDDLERDDDDLYAEDLAKEVYQELETNRFGTGADVSYFQKMVKIADTFDIDHISVNGAKETVVEKFAENNEYKKALRSADRWGVSSIEDDRNVQDVANDGYNDKMQSDEYIGAAEIAKEARMSFNREETQEDYLEKEKEAAKEAFKQSLDQGNYNQAKTAVRRFNTEGNEEEMQTYLIKKLTNDEIDRDQYQEFTDEIGYTPEEQTESQIEQKSQIEQSSTTESQSEPEPPADYEESEGYLSRLNPFS